MPNDFTARWKDALESSITAKLTSSAMSSILYRVLFVYACLALAPSHAAETGGLPLFTSYYSLYVLGVKVGEGVRKLKSVGDGQFVFESHSTTSGMIAVFRDDNIDEHSLWDWHDGQIRPINYLYRHSGTYKQKRSELTFDWDKGLVHFNHKGKQGDLELSPGVLDQLVYQLVLMNDLRQGKRGDISYRIADGNNLKDYTLGFVGEEVLEIPLGKFTTLKFERVDEDQRRSALWCAPQLAYLPVQVEHQEPKGEKVTLTLDRVEGLQ